MKNAVERYLLQRIDQDLQRKMVILTGPRQVGKTTLSRQIMACYPGAQYLNYDVPAERAALLYQQWSAESPLLVFDELHKMSQWKPWLKGVFDGRGQLVDGQLQRLLVTGSVRMETFRQVGESLAGRYFKLRLHPLSVHEWCQQSSASPEQALAHLMVRGGFPEPCLAAANAEGDIAANRWRTDYFQGLIREDVLEFSRIQEVNAMRVFAQTLRTRVGSPLSLASIGRDMGVSPVTLKKYLEILEALFIVFTVRPWHHNIARSTLMQPKVYFFDNGLVDGDEGVRFENLVACHLLKFAQWQEDTQGIPGALHYIRTQDGAEVDFALSQTQGAHPFLSHLIECKWADSKPHRALLRFSAEHPKAHAMQWVRQLQVPYQAQGVRIARASEGLFELGV
jgi:predicted AAA+ superfamily ATPase